MTATSRAIPPYISTYGICGRLLPGAQLFYYTSGGNRIDNPLTTYSDPALSIPNPYPVVADPYGAFGNIFLLPEDYGVDLLDVNNVLVVSADPTAADFLIDSAVYTDLGLTGGGSLADAVTISMGTPGTLTSITTNNATGGSSPSHVHALDIPEIAIAIASQLAAQVNPPGLFGSFAMPTAPAGWLLCNGTTVSRTIYSNLFAAIGTYWGAGDGSSTFGLPDGRGYFLRGFNNGSGTSPDVGRTFGSAQTDAIRNITGTFITDDHFANTGTGAFTVTGGGTQPADLGTDNLSAIVSFDASTVVTTAADNRPYNLTAYICICTGGQ
jgi:microcystin-dependent protein